MQRPQPIDLDPWPLGGLLVPRGEDGDAWRHAALLGTRDEDTSGPEFLQRAVQDDVQGAQRAVVATDGDEQLADYNRFVLEPDAGELKHLRGRFTGVMAELLELAAYRAGLRDDLPEFSELDGELLAAARASQATLAIESDDLAHAAELLDDAVERAGDVSPGLAAQLCLSLTEVENSRGMGPARTVELLERARQLLPEVGFDTLRGELALELGTLLQEAPEGVRPDPSRAASLFQEATRSLDPRRHRRAHGFAQMRLGLTYLAMPMRDAGDALRMGVAVRALNQSVDVLDQQLDADLWTAAATNLANALQLLPSEHLERNLRRAVALYDRVLELRTAEQDPHGRARTLLNKAQAAASLEESEVASDALTEACPLLQKLGYTDELASARAMREDLRRGAVVHREESA